VGEIYTSHVQFFSECNIENGVNIR